MKSEQVLLTLTGVSKSFPGVKALDNVDFELRRGEVHALVGENGAGKSTLMKIISGVYVRDSGQISLEGAPISVRNVHDARRLGISIIFQELSLIPQLTVAQNIFLGEEPRGPAGLLNDRRLVDAAEGLLRDNRINVCATTPVGRLSAAERQLVEIAKAISIGSKILIMDEPTSSLTLDETSNLFEIVSSLRGRGTGIIYISHRMDEIARVADRITVLRDGKGVGTFRVKDITVDQVVRLMVGRELATVDAAGSGGGARGGAPVLEIRELTRSRVLKDISFSLYPGEILGLAGLVGSGRSEVARALFGVDPIDSGEVLIDGKPVHLQTPASAIAAGVALLPEDRRQQGLIVQHSVERNVMLPLWREHRRGMIADDRTGRRITQDAIHSLQIRPPDPQKIVHFLSGGNQQKVVLAKWLASKPKVLIMDEPTAGVDVGAKAEIHQLMRNLAAEGVAILLISSDMPEIIAMCDRLLVMHAGRVLREISRAEVSQELIMATIMDGVLAREVSC